MAKQVTRWVGKTISAYEFWSEKPIYSRKDKCFVDEAGYGAPDSFLEKECQDAIENMVPVLKKIKVGEVRKVTIIVH